MASLRVLLLAISLALVPSLTHAQELPAAATPVRATSVPRTIGLGVAGALTAFLAHETGHVFANLMLGNNPNFDGTLVWGWLPFVVVAPGIDCDHEGPCTDRAGARFRAGQRGYAFIVSAGFHVQHLLDEALLARAPDLRFRYAPLQKGMLLFNVALSCIYAVGAYTGLEDPHGDLAGAARVSGIHPAWLASLLLVPAALDTYRFWVPGSRWAPWASRGSKALFLGLNFTF